MELYSNSDTIRLESHFPLKSHQCPRLRSLESQKEELVSACCNGLLDLQPSIVRLVQFCLILIRALDLAGVYGSNIGQ